MEKLEKNLEFSSQYNSIDLLMDDEDIMVVSMDLLHEDEKNEHNRNMCNISHKCILKSMHTFKNKPLECRFNSKYKELVTDVTEHSHTEEEKFEMRICGVIPSDSRIKFIKRDNGKIYCNVEAIIYKKLLPHLAKIIKDNNNQMKVSCVFKALGNQDEDSGVFIIDEFNLEQVTLLGQGVTEGIENSHFEVIEPTEEQITFANTRYLQFSANRQNSSENIFTQINNKKNKENVKLTKLTLKVLERRIWHELKKYKYSDGSWHGERYWYEDIDTENKEVIVHDNQTDEMYAIPYKVSKEGDVTLKEEERRKVVKDENYRYVENTCDFLFAKEEYGKGDRIEVDKDKDAVSDTEWGKISKTALRKEVLDASNYKDLVHDVYLVVEDGWEDAPSEKLKYPVMEIKDGKAVYNRYGLASALGYAKAEKADSLVEKIEDIYDDLDLDDDEEDSDDKENSACGKAKISNSVEEEWKKKYDEMKKAFDNKCKEYSNMAEELKKYKDKEAREEMKAYLEENKEAFSKSDMAVMASYIDNLTMSVEEFKKEVDDKFISFLKNKYKSDKENKNESCEKEFSIMKDFTKNARAEFETSHNGDIYTPDEINKILNI